MNVLCSTANYNAKLQFQILITFLLFLSGLFKLEKAVLSLSRRLQHRKWYRED